MLSTTWMLCIAVLVLKVEWTDALDNGAALLPPIGKRLIVLNPIDIYHLLHMLLYANRVSMMTPYRQRLELVVFFWVRAQCHFL